MERTEIPGRLPIALKSALEDSERRFQNLLSRLGLSREEFHRIADRKKPRTGKPGPNNQRRTFDV